MLLYPSQKLSELYNPIENLDNKNVKKDVYKEFEKIAKTYTNKTYRAKKFHYLLPLIVDDEEYVEKWFETIKDIYPKAVENLKKERIRVVFPEKILISGCVGPRKGLAKGKIVSPRGYVSGLNLWTPLLWKDC